KVASPPAEEVVQLMLPEEEAGPVRETPWAELQLGEWDTRVDVPGDPDSVANPVMQGLMEEMAQHIVQEDVKAYEKGLDEGLPNGYGKMIIEEWQDGLKKITMRIFWQPEGVDEQTFEKTFFIHEEAGYGE
ncbi:MAG: hypothetical protein KDH89_17455, partial [Anaerolineae bacterium]|nr:hypothetical protein [Anaerolineae bacterium]